VRDRSDDDDALTDGARRADIGTPEFRGRQVRLTLDLEPSVSSCSGRANGSSTSAVHRGCRRVHQCPTSSCLDTTYRRHGSPATVRPRSPQRCLPRVRDSATRDDQARLRTAPATLGDRRDPRSSSCSEPPGSGSRGADLVAAGATKGQSGRHVGDRRRSVRAQVWSRLLGLRGDVRESEQQARYPSCLLAESCRACDPTGVVRWKLPAWVCLVVVLGGWSARSISQSTAGSAHRTAARPAESPIRWIAVRQLAHGTLPHRRTFTIIGERYRFQGRVYFSLAVSINRPGAPPGGGGGASFNPSQSRGVLPFTFMTVCGHHPYAVVFGLLRATTDNVVARRGHGTTVLQHVLIPGALHARGVLVYAPLAGPPSELIVRQPDGKRVLDQRFPSNVPCPAGAVVGVI
jgi:hypothetical protein